MKRITSTAGMMLACGLVFGQEPAKPVVTNLLLDLPGGAFRVFTGWKTPVLVSTNGELKPLLEVRCGNMKEEERKPMPMHESDRPVANWNTPDFDDTVWPRSRDMTAGLNLWVTSRGGSFPMPDLLEGNLVCVRGKFRVTDPAQVTDLKVHLCYQGGAVVYVNGVELARGHLPAGTLAPHALATRYAEDAYVDTNGVVRRGMCEDPKGIAELLQVRGREIKPGAYADGLAIPGAMLRKGVNVVAIEVRTAPVHESLVEGTAWKGALRDRQMWLHAAVADVRVVSVSGAGLVANAVPPTEIAIGNSQPIETDYAWDAALPQEQISPIRMVGVRNGTFSGKVVLSSAGAIKNLKATVSDLVQSGGKGKIAASAIQLRVAERARPDVSWVAGNRFDRLLSEFPAEIAPVSPDRRHAPMAVAPVWVTVKVPADAPAGEYTGTLVVEAAGTAPAKFSVPVQVKVNDWRLPDPKDFTTHNDIYSSEDTLAKIYKVPLWSDKHFELIGKSMVAFQQVGNKLCTLHLAIKSPGINNSESIVRWIKKPDGTYDYDFTVMEKYLDTYAKNCGKPGILSVGDLDKTRAGKNPGTNGFPRLNVSLLDPTTGKLEPLTPPPYGTPENEAFWRPVLTELRQRLEKRGWFDVTVISHNDYASPPIKEFVGTIKRIWPDVRWLQNGHPYLTRYESSDGSYAPVACVEYVWGAGGLFDPDYRGEAMYNPQRGGYPRAWLTDTNTIRLANPRYRVGFVADAFRTSCTLAEYRFLIEGGMQGGVQGIGRVGGDAWPVPRGEGAIRGYEGNYEMDCAFDYDIGGTGPAENVVAIFCPGPDGAAFGQRAEMFREGVQVAEAIIFLQRAVVNKQVGDDIAKRIDDLLLERARYFLRSAYFTRTGTRLHPLECSNWQTRDDKLFALCAEVAKASAK
jgi:hypothetical protein